MIDHILSFLFPSYCYLCKKEESPLCDDCIHNLPHAFETPFPYITSLFLFKDDRVKRIIHAGKYNNRKDLLIRLATKLSKELTDTPHDAILIPIPMPRKRKLIRGYNQSEVVAEEIGKYTGLHVEKSLLSRRKDTLRQVKTRSRKERIKNQHNTFVINKDVQNLVYILIDDVTTTGATIKEARKILMEHGAKEVRAYTLAH